MWTVADLLLGFVVLASLIGFRVGPHSHLAAGVVGVLAAVWLAVMAGTGHADPLLWTALTADVIVSAGVGTLAWKGLQGEHLAEHHPILPQHTAAAEGVATTDLDPDGLVRVRGESWSATSLNGRIAKGTKIQVIETKGVRLEVWGEEAEPTEVPSATPFHLEDHHLGISPEEQRSETT